MCGKSFIYTVTLLRVIEMMIHFDRNIIIDQEGSLGRVFQVTKNTRIFFSEYNTFVLCFSVNMSNS